MSIPRFERIFTIINPASGRNEPILNTLNDLFHPAGIDWDVRITREHGDGARYAREAAEQGCDLIMAYGGDGTLLDVAEGIIDTGVPVAFLPGGTANAMIDELRIPGQLKAAAELALQPDAALRTIDVGRCNDRHFLLRVGCGLVGRMSTRVSRDLKDRFGLLAYVIAGMQAFSDNRVSAYRLTIDGETVETQGIAVLVANVSAAGGNINVRFSRKVQVDDGIMDVFVLRDDPRWLLDMLRSVTYLQEEMIEAIEHYQGREISIETDEPEGLYADGESEPLAETPASIAVVPGALRVLVPGASVKNTDEDAGEGAGGSQDEAG